MGALIHAGLDLAHWRKELALLSLGEWKVAVDTAGHGNIEGVRADWTLKTELPATSLTDLLRRLSSSTVPPDVRNRAMAACRLTARHQGEDHEVNTGDALFLIGAHLACHLLDLGPHYHSPFFLSDGIDPQISTHIHGRRVVVDFERTRPITMTAVAFLLTIAQELATECTLAYDRVCVGLGDNLTNGRLDALLLHVGKEPFHQETRELFQVEATIDDMNPELYPPLLTLLRERGARDAWWTPSTTRMGRPGSTIVVLIPKELLQETAEILFSETSTIGVRYHAISRLTLPRIEERIRTSVGMVKVKTVTLPNGNLRRKPDLGDCVTIARKKGRPVMEVRELILRESEEPPHTS